MLDNTTTLREGGPAMNDTTPNKEHQSAGTAPPLSGDRAAEEEASGAVAPSRLVRFVFGFILGSRVGCPQGKTRSGGLRGIERTPQKGQKQRDPQPALHRRHVLHTLVLSALSLRSWHPAIARPQSPAAVDAVGARHLSNAPQSSDPQLPGSRWWMLTKSELNEVARKYPNATEGSHRMILGTWQ